MAHHEHLLGAVGAAQGKSTRRVADAKFNSLCNTQTAAAHPLTSRSCSCVLEAPPSRLFTKPPTALDGPAPSSAVHASDPVTMSRMDIFL